MTLPKHGAAGRYRGSLRLRSLFPGLFIAHVAQDANTDARRKMLARINAAVADAYHLPDFAIFLHEHSLDTVVINGRILADDAQGVADQTEAYS